MNKEATKKAIELLVKVMRRQQQIIQKLADVPAPDEHRDPNIDLLVQDHVRAIQRSVHCRKCS